MNFYFFAKSNWSLSLKDSGSPVLSYTAATLILKMDLKLGNDRTVYVFLIFSKREIKRIKSFPSCSDWSGRSVLYVPV